MPRILSGSAARKHVETDSPHRIFIADNRGYQRHGDDVVMVVKDRMASVEVSQIILMLPAADLGRIHGLPHAAAWDPPAESSVPG